MRKKIKEIISRPFVTGDVDEWNEQAVDDIMEAVREIVPEIIYSDTPSKFDNGYVVGFNKAIKEIVKELE